MHNQKHTKKKKKKNKNTTSTSLGMFGKFKINKREMRAKAKR